MENKVTVKDVLEEVMETLNGISIPVSQIDDIGLPIARAIGGIKACVDAMEKAEAEAAAKEQETAEEGDQNDA